PVLGRLRTRSSTMAPPWLRHWLPGKAKSPRRVRLGIEALEARFLLSAAGDRFVDAVYHDLLGHPAGPAGRALWGGLVDQGVPRTAIALAIATSPEARMTQVQGLFGTFLGHPAGPPGIDGFTGFLQAGGTREQAEALLLGSPEYFLRRGGTNR